MTKFERKKILEAIKYIHTDEEDGGDYHIGMDILADLLKADRKRRMRKAIIEEEK